MKLGSYCGYEVSATKSRITMTEKNKPVLHSIKLMDLLTLTQTMSEYPNPEIQASLLAVAAVAKLENRCLVPIGRFYDCTVSLIVCDEPYFLVRHDFSMPLDALRHHTIPLDALRKTLTGSDPESLFDRMETAAVVLALAYLSLTQR